jgi:hypothetical protein
MKSFSAYMESKYRANTWNGILKCPAGRTYKILTTTKNSEKIILSNPDSGIKLCKFHLPGEHIHQKPAYGG